MSIEYFEAKPQKHYPPELSALIRFAHSTSPVTCPVCRKSRNRLWTMLCPFTAAIVGKHIGVVEPEPTVHAPLTLVCEDHPILPSDDIRIALEGGDRNTNHKGGK